MFASQGNASRGTMASTSNDRYKLVFFAPPLDLPKIKEAIFAAGAGSFEKYSQVGFTSPGVGQFLPGDSANPHIGERGKVEEVGEVKFETVCSGRDVMKEVVSALKR